MPFLLIFYFTHVTFYSSLKAAKLKIKAGSWKIFFGEVLTHCGRK
jgi:hypothetical protein